MWYAVIWSSVSLKAFQPSPCIVTVFCKTEFIWCLKSDPESFSIFVWPTTGELGQLIYFHLFLFFSFIWETCISLTVSKHMCGIYELTNKSCSDQLFYKINNVEVPHIFLTLAFCDLPWEMYRMFPFIICLILMNYLMEFYFIGFVNAHLPGCFCPWTFRLNIGLNTSPSDSFVSYLNSHLGYSAGEFQALQLIVLAVFGAVD